MSGREDWGRVNRALIAKSIGELSYEGVLKPVKEGLGHRLALKCGVVYRFEAWLGIWDHLRVSPDSLRREADGSLSAGQFFLDIQEEAGMSDITLGNFLEEMHNTLYSDLRLLKKQRETSIEQLCSWSDDRVQSVLPGHPKLLLNKGRMGWGAEELERFAPESGRSFQLHWLAIRKDHATHGLGEGMRTEFLLQESFDPESLRNFLAEAKARCRGQPELFDFLPVHPWQWERVIRIQFAAEIAEGSMVPLGVHGDEYRPQISIRTLSNASRPGKADIKLPLSILNTSAVRGISSKYIPVSPMLSESVSTICERDEVLAGAGTGVLREMAAIGYRHPLFTKVPGAPYRYQEYLAAIWRESAISKVAKGESALITGALFYQDPEGRSLIASLIDRSGLGTEEWLRLYFRSVVVPLYHLQQCYGIGLVAHGQNIVLKLRDSRPAGMLIKDFQGDLRLSKAGGALGPLEGPAWGHLDRLPPEYLIHDLITGHFVTVLRFVSEALQESKGFPEIRFYSVLAREIERYGAETGFTPEPGSALDLLREKLPRVLVNRVRFKIGYSDSSERPLPMVGEELLNPLHLGWRQGGDRE